MGNVPSITVTDKRGKDASFSLINYMAPLRYTTNKEDLNNCISSIMVNESKGNTQCGCQKSHQENLINQQDLDSKLWKYYEPTKRT